MATAWIKLEMTTPDKPEVVCIAGALRMDQDAVLGKLIRIWAWADQNSISGDDVRVTAAFIDRLTGKRGFAAAMREAGWLAGKDGALVFPGFERHNGDSAKARAEAARRMAKSRSGCGNVTETAQPKRNDGCGSVAENPQEKAQPDKSKRESKSTAAPHPQPAAAEFSETVVPIRQAYPPKLAASPEFVACWEQRWLPYLAERKGGRLPSIMTLESQLATCLKLGPALALAALVSAIEKGWAAPDENVKPLSLAVARPADTEPDDWKAYWRTMFPPEDFPDAPRYENGEWRDVRNDHKREIVSGLAKQQRRRTA